jgi:hypothetical protein
MERPEKLLRSLRENDTRAVVLNLRPARTKLRPAMLRRFEELFPNSRAIGRFLVRWKD